MVPKIHEDLPVVFCENDRECPLSHSQTTVAIEMMIVSDFLLCQMAMPMVRWMGGGMNVIRCFQDCTLAILNTLLQAGLVNKSFYEKHRVLFNGEKLRKHIQLEPIQVYQLLYDVYYETEKYQVIIGAQREHELPPSPEDHPYYGNPTVFKPGM